MPGDIHALRFEHKPERYPVGPRTPNLDLLFELTDGHRVGVESKFVEPYRSARSKIVLSGKYFPAGEGLWEKQQMSGAQKLASHPGDGWKYLDIAQLLKHMLGLACESDGHVTLLYLWYDTGFAEASAQRAEVARFSDIVSADRVGFRSMTYQHLFTSLPESAEPSPRWREYMSLRYFS